MNKQQLVQKIWASANQMRSKIEANEYKDYILGFIFYKYLSDKEVKFLKENDYDDELLKTVSEEDDETLKWVQENIGYFIAYRDLFSTWLSMGKDFDVSNVRDALSAFSRLISNTHKKVFDKVFETLQTGLSKFGDSSGSQTKTISGLLTLIEEYLNDVVESQGKLFDLVAQEYPDKDTEEFINTYMASKTRKSIDEAKAYVNTMDAKELWAYFTETENYLLKEGKALEGFMPSWIGEFYAYYQWYYNLPSAELVEKIPVSFLKKAYAGLHDLELDLAVKKVGEV